MLTFVTLFRKWKISTSAVLNSQQKYQSCQFREHKNVFVHFFDTHTPTSFIVLPIFYTSSQRLIPKTAEAWGQGMGSSPLLKKQVLFSHALEFTSKCAPYGVHSSQCTGYSTGLLACSVIQPAQKEGIQRWLLHHLFFLTQELMFL